MYGPPVDLTKYIGHRSTLRNVWVTGRPFEIYGPPVDHGKPREAMGRHGKPWLLKLSGRQLPLGQAREATGSHGKPQEKQCLTVDSCNMFCDVFAEPLHCHDIHVRNIDGPFYAGGSELFCFNCMGHWSSFPNALKFKGRPFEMYGSPVDLSKCMGHRSTFLTVKQMHMHRKSDGQ